MGDRILQNHWCRLLAGNLSVALLAVGIPLTVMFSIMKTLAVPMAGLVILAIAHAALIGLQISRRGTWIPEKWLAAGYLILPVIDAMLTVRWFDRDHWVEAFCAFLLLMVAAFVTIWIVRNQWRKWRSPEPKTVIVPRRTPNESDINYPSDDPTSLVY